MKKVIDKRVIEALKILKTPKNYAKGKTGKNKKALAPQYIYNLIRDNKIDFISIDGIPFIIDPENNNQ
jgi:hypothetical protein